MSDYDDGSVRLEGFDTLIGRLTVLPGNAKEAALDAMLQIAEEKVMPDAKNTYTPFDLGNLYESGTVWREGDQIILAFGIPGSIAEPYAVEQHENLSFHHDIGGNKYLERPLIAWADRIIEAAGEAVKNVLELNTDRKSFKIITDFPTPTLFDQLVMSKRHLKATPAAPAKPKLGPPRLVKKPK